MRDRGSSRGPFRRALPALLGIALLVQFAPAGADTREELKAAKRRLRVIEGQLAAEQSRLDAIRAEIEGMIRRIQQAHFQKDALEFRIREAKREIRQKGDRIDRLQGRLNQRARDAYIDGPGGVVEFVLEADSLTDLTDRVAFLDVLSQADSDLAVGVDVERESLLRFEGDLEDLLVEQAELLKLLARQKEELDRAFAVQIEITARMERKVQAAERVVKDLRARYQRELLAAAREYAQTGVGPPLHADGPFYVCPVDPPRSYINDWGYPRPGGRTHQGNDIFAPEGTPIRAPFEGTADESSNGLGGLAVYVHASDGTYVYNAHLSRYAGVDGHVEMNAIIGYVGNTGNASGGPTHDHFEYHPGGGGAINPYPYLNEVCL